MKRRQFLTSAACSGAFVSATALGTARAAGANQRVRIGLIGCGGRGRFVAQHMCQVPQVELAAVCDVYEPNLARAQSSGDKGCTAYSDFRQLLDQPQVDAVVVATPDHWHAIITVMACAAGKDVYVEKPLAHNIREGQAMVEAAREHHRIVQVGTQQRSAAHFAEMRQIVQSGELGKVHFVRIWNYRNIFPRGMGRQPVSSVPKGLDWDFYLGPAPMVPFNPNRFLGNFRWYWDYAGGIITDWGTHRFDSMHQVMGVDAPTTVSAAGQRFELDDGGEVPDILQVTYEYPGFVVSYEACALNAHGCGGRTPGRAYYGANSTDDRPNGLAFYGTNGALFADRIGFEIYPELRPGASPRRPPADGVSASLFRMDRKEASTTDSTFQHVTNFIECVRSRQQPAADIHIGHRASIVAHLGNIAYKTGRKIKWDPASEAILDDVQASQLVGRIARKPWDLL